jgi:uncharacterized protein YyaL (SSP411 family)
MVKVMSALPGSQGHPPAVAERIAATRTDQSVAVRTRHVADDGRPLYTNRLALEASPYLRQHAHNPVDWFPWSDEAFNEARRLDRPVFLSIGYSTCHWCHVMEEESFEDETIATFLNANYIAIKVDREERPDVDAVYMKAAHQLGGSGGWPLSVWLTAERQPFFVGTYFPPFAGRRGASYGFLEVLTELLQMFHGDRSRVRQAADALAASVRSDMEAGEVAAAGDGDGDGNARIDSGFLASVVEQCAHAFDEHYGGIRVQQKFPSQMPIRLLLRQHQRTKDARALTMAVRTLEAMATGGLYDQLVGGFHRYSTDPQWHVPHFEKMLYDNALLVVAYAEAWQATQRPLFARIVRETCDELLATFAADGGGFYSATDADSEGVEGKYFVWTEDEIRAVLGATDEAEVFLRHFGVQREGDFEGANVLHQPKPDEEITRQLNSARQKLAEVRRQRVPPLRDDKIIAAWNGLAISAFAVAGRILGEPRYVAAAERAADFVCSRVRAPSGGLARTFRDGALGGPGFLDDYAFVTAGLIDLFESTGKARHFDEAVRLADETHTLFGDHEHGGWFSSSAAHETLLARNRPAFDGAEPAGSSVALMNLARLAAFTDDTSRRNALAAALAFYTPAMRERPLALTEALLAADFTLGPIREIAIALPSANAEAPELAEVLRRTFCPRKALVVGVPGSADWTALQARIPWLRDKPAVQLTTAFVCTDQHCHAPTSEAGTLLAQLLGP